MSTLPKRDGSKGNTATAAFLLAFLGLTAQAQQAAQIAFTPKPQNEQWQFELAAYGWLSGVGSSLQKGDVDSTTEMSFGDILDVLDFAGFIRLEARKGAWGLFSELDYVKLSESTEVRVPAKGIPLRLDASGNLKETIAELGGIRTFEKRNLGFDLLAGARYFRFDLNANLGPLTLGREKEWVDPFVGTRLRINLAEKWALSIRGDVGGFGLGSDLTWNTVAILRYQLSESVAAGVGYRYLDVDYDRGGLLLDSQTHGPLIGVAFRF